MVGTEVGEPDGDDVRIACRPPVRSWTLTARDRAGLGDGRPARADAVARLRVRSLPRRSMAALQAITGRSSSQPRRDPRDRPRRPASKAQVTRQSDDQAPRGSATTRRASRSGRGTGTSGSSQGRAAVTRADRQGATPAGDLGRRGGEEAQQHQRERDARDQVDPLRRQRGRSPRRSRPARTIGQSRAMPADASGSGPTLRRGSATSAPGTRASRGRSSMPGGVHDRGARDRDVEHLRHRRGRRRRSPAPARPAATSVPAARTASRP